MDSKEQFRGKQQDKNFQNALKTYDESYNSNFEGKTPHVNN